MTTKTYNTLIDHSSDAGYRAWGSELKAAFIAAGLVNTADTGQINWTTVVRPGTGVINGYEIYSLPDSTLFFKFEYGTGGSTGAPKIFLTVGQGSNGAGALTGQQSTRNSITSDVSPFSLTTAYPTYIAVTNNYLMFHWKIGANGGTAGYILGSVIVGKTVNDAGATTTDGYAVLRQNAAVGNPSLQCVRMANIAVPTTYPESIYIAVVPGNPTTSLTGTDIQAYQIWLNMPEVRPFAWAFAYIINDINMFTSVDLALVGATVHTYLCPGPRVSGMMVNNQSGVTIAMIYE